jgi:raffinose/stachyose/melibiose transport system permease protein
MNLIKTIITGILMYVVLLFTIIVSIFPILWIIISAFKTNAQILSNPFLLPERIDFTPFVRVFTQYNFLQYTINSFSIAAVSSVLSLLFFSMAAYVLSKYNFTGKNFLYILFTLTLLVPGHTKAQPIFSLILSLNLYDKKSALILVYLSAGLAMSMFVLKAAFMTIPIEFNEAASIEGAGFFRKFWSINLPLVKSGLVTSGILMFLGNWNEYFYAMLLTSSPENRTLPLALAFFNEAFSYDYTKMFAALTMVVLPGIIIYTFAQEQIQASVASSGVKG